MKKPKVIGIADIPITQLEGAPLNPNVMSEDEETALAAGVDQLGFLQPILVNRLAPDRYRIIDGHHRAEAGAKAGYGKLPCFIVETTPDNEAIIALSMNKIRGELNLGDVAKVLADLDSQGWTTPELTVTGFSEDEITSLLKAVATPTEDEVIETSAALGPEDDEAPEDDPGGPFTLELGFGKKADFQRAKKALRKAAGKGRELGDGLLRLIDAEGDES